MRGRLTRRSVIATLVVVAGLACSSAQRFEEELGSSRVLAAAAVKATLDNGGFETMMSQAVASSYSVARTRLEAGGRKLTEAQSRQLEAAIRGVMSEVYPRAAWDSALAPLFEDNLSREELEEVVRFQRSEIGAKLLAITVTVMTGGSALGERLMQSRRDEFSRRLGEELNRTLKLEAGR